MATHIRAWEIVLLRFEGYCGIDAEVTALVLVKDTCKYRWRIEVGHAVALDCRTTMRHKACEKQVTTYWIHLY